MSTEGEVRVEARVSTKTGNSESANPRIKREGIHIPQLDHMGIGYDIGGMSAPGLSTSFTGRLAPGRKGEGTFGSHFMFEGVGDFWSPRSGHGLGGWFIADWFFTKEQAQIFLEFRF